MSSLMHHGVKGQRWGIRRFQNKDGTLTATGRKRKQHLIEVGSGKRKRLIEAAKPIGISGDYSRDVAGLNRRGIHGRVINEDDNTHVIKKGTSIYRTAANSELNDDGTYGSLTKNDVDRYIDYGRSGELPGADKSNLNSMKIFEFSANRDLKIANGKYITEIITDDVKHKMKNGDADQVKLGKEILESFKRYEEDLNLSFSTSEMRRSKEAYSRTEKEKEFDRDLVGKASDRLALYDKTILDYSSGKDYRVIRDRLKREGYDGFIDVEDVTTIENLVRGGANTEYPVVILNANDVLTLKQSVKESETQRRLKRGTKFNSSRGELTDVVQHTSIGGTMYIEGNALILGDSSYLEHHGILGQKWGVRRFQNKDGTRTAAGKAREDRRVLKKGTTVKRTSYGMYDETYDNKKYVSTNDDDAGKWSRYIGEARARQGAVVFENEYRLKRDVAVATGKDICKIIDSEFKNADVTKLKEDTDYAARALRQDLNNMSREERVSLNFAMQTQSGKKIVKLLKKHGYDALEDDHGKNVSKDPVIILDPEKNMKKTRVTANTHYYFDYINHTSIDDSPHLSHHGIKGQRWGVRRFQNKDGTRTAAGKARDAESLRSSQEAKNVSSKIHSYINKQLSSEDLDTGKSNFDFASDLVKDPDFEKVIMPVVQDIRQTKAKYGNKEPYELTGDEHKAYMNDISRIDNKAGELAIAIGLAEKGEPHKKTTPPEGEYERVDMFRYALARYLDEHSPDGYSDEGDWIYHSSMEGTLFIEDETLYLSHHGIRGQRWGVRRFQNRDGSLTNAGRKRLGYATKGAAQTVGKAFKAGVKAGGNAVKAVKAHHEKKEAEKLQKKKEKASKTRLGVMANKDLFTNEEIRKLNERFKLEDEMKMATLQKGVEIAKAVGTIAQNVGTMAKAYEDVTGQSLSPIKRKAAEEKAKQDAEDRKRKLAKEDAETKRAEDKEKRDIEDRERRIKFEDEDRVRKQAKEDADAQRAENAEKRAQAKEQRDSSMAVELQRKAKAAADEQEHKAVKAKAESRSAILDVLEKIDKIQDHDDDDHNNPPGGGIDTWDDDDYLNFFKKTGIIHSDISDPSIIQNGVLSHHGVKGQKWGVRRFQNEDGSLTPKGRKHYEKALAKEKRKQVSSDAIRGTLERQHPFAVTGAAIMGAVAAGMSIAATGGASVAMIAAGSAITGAISAGLTHVSYSASEAWEGRGTKKRSKKIAKYESMLKQASMEEGMYHVENGTLFINAGEPYLEHHGVKGMKWGKHLMAGKGVDAEAGAGGGFAEDDEKLKEMAKKAGMTVAEYKQKFASKIGGAASKVGEKVYDAAGGSHKTEAAEYRKLSRDASNEARKYEASGNADLAKAASARRKGNTSAHSSYKTTGDNAKDEARKARERASALSEGARQEQVRYEKSLAGKYDKMKSDRARKKSIKQRQSVERALSNGPVEAKPKKGLGKRLEEKLGVSHEKTRGKKQSREAKRIENMYKDAARKDGMQAKREKRINDAKNSVEKAARSNEAAYKHATEVYRQTGRDSDAYRQAIKRSQTTLWRSLDNQERLKQKKRRPADIGKKRAKHFDDTNAIYTEGTRLVINSKWG